jgi:hypothetical protein
MKAEEKPQYSCPKCAEAEEADSSELWVSVEAMAMGHADVTPTLEIEGDIQDIESYDLRITSESDDDAGCNTCGWAGKRSEFVLVGPKVEYTDLGEV